jgi:parallel beta-helix repeat protein
VNSLTDTGAGSGLAGDLRYCITNATSGNDTITFGVTGTITLESALPALDASVAIQGPGASQLKVERDPVSTSSFDIFEVGSAANVQISSLTIAHGTRTNLDSAGAIVNAGTLTVSACTFSDNAHPYSPAGAGAIWNTGTLTLEDDLFGGSTYADNSGNSVIENHGSAAVLTVSNSTISHNPNDGIHNSGSVTISNSTISNNFGTGILIYPSGSATISNSTFSDNYDEGIFNFGVATVSNSTVSGDGIGIANSGSVTVGYSTFSSDGIGIYNDNSGSATVSYSTLTRCGPSGVFPSNEAGAIYNSGNLAVNNSTISGNKAVGTAATITGSGAAYLPGDGKGGGIYMAGGTLSINSSTIADNQAIGGSTVFGYPFSAGNGYGGGLYIAGGMVTIDHSTLAGNQASSGYHFYFPPGTGYGGGIYNAASPSALQMHDTILADDTADVGSDLDGSATSQGYNLIGNSSGGSGFVASDLLNVDPQLGPLQYNGGPTQTLALMPGSPAIDAGDNTGAPACDQRGFTRIVGGAIDIGAFEVQPANQVTHFGVSAPATAVAGSTFNVTVQALDDSGNLVSGYTGTVYFTSSDGQAILPADYTFTGADGGTHTFSVTLLTAGTQSITATDPTTAGLTGTDGSITVNPAAASQFIITGPDSVTAGFPFNLTLTVEDAYGNLATGYSGTVHVSSTDDTATLPFDFTGAPHTFTVVLWQTGNQTITCTDTENSSLTDSVIVDVL